MPQVLTKPGTRKLSDVARHVVVPVGIVATGYPAVRDKCRDMGIVHDDWQQGLGRLALGKRADGKYAATVGGVVMSIPRQVGKTFLVGSIAFALCLLFPGLTVIWTAHRSRTSNETFRKLQGLAKRSKVAPHVLNVRTANGEQEIEFRNGSRILFGAREQGFGRGFDEVDIEVFDEAQILTEKTLEDMVAATNQSRQPAGALLFYMGTPPRPTDPGEAFANKRRKALESPPKDAVYVEISADANADPDDQKQWAKANPSFPLRTPLESMLRLRENVGSDESFLREGLGVWDSDVSRKSDAALDPAEWAATEDASAAMLSVDALAVEVSTDLAWTSIGAAGPTADGARLLFLASRKRGTVSAVDDVVELARRKGVQTVALDGKGQANDLIGPLQAAGLTVLVGSGEDRAAACGQLVRDVATRVVVHGPQGDVDAAIEASRRGSYGDGLFVFSRRTSIGDISALYALAFANWAASQPAQVSAYEDGELVVA